MSNVKIIISSIKKLTMKKSITIKKFVESLERHGTIIPLGKAEAVLELVYKLSELAVKIELDKIQGVKNQNDKGKT